MARFFLLIEMDNIEARVIYMGTPAFAVAPLQALFNAGVDICAVVTVPDKPSGRGQKLTMSPVKLFAIEHQIPVLQPISLKADEFVDVIKSLQADVIIVVAFRMLPEVIWRVPKYGTFNLHASILPRYRGAAPINWAIINGDTETGLTTFFINESIDAGEILLQERISINEEETAGELHDRMMPVGSALVIRTLNGIINKDITPVCQSENEEVVISQAPKIFKTDCRINFQHTRKKVLNHIRGLSPYPSAYLSLESPSGQVFQMKVFKAIKSEASTLPPFGLKTDGKSFIEVGTANGEICLIDLQLESKKRMNVIDFLRGFEMNNQWKILNQL